MELAHSLGTALVDRIASAPLNLVQPYHDIAGDVIHVLVRYCHVPAEAAPPLALAGVLFVPLFFVAALFLSTHGYRGHPKCAF